MRVNTLAREDIARIEKTLFFEPPDMSVRLIRFFMLMLFASIIATGGLLSDSVASIIGAMIVAPLMTPIMGIVVALVMGSPPRLARSLILVATGIVLAVAVGWIMAKVMPFGWNPMQSEQVLARTSPRLIDLVIALASGGAGAYALRRSDVADALPGVAIAISLVPPLNTVGVLLAGGENELAKGAMLLFTTNFVAILLAGTLVFVITGLATGVGRSAKDLRMSLLAIVIVAAIIAIPLRINSQDLWSDTRNEDRVYDVVSDWLEGTSYVIESVVVDDNEIKINIAGEGDLPASDEVIRELRDVVGQDMVLNAHIVAVRNVTIQP